MTLNLTGPPYVGWLRAGEPGRLGPWLKVCQATTERECWARLLDVECRCRCRERLVNRGEAPDEGRKSR